MQFNQTVISAFGYELPPNILTSAEIENLLAPIYSKLKLPEGRLELMSGIKERRLWNAGTKPSQGAILAGKKAMENAKVKPEQIQSLIFSSVSRDMMEPATASFVHSGLGLPQQCHTFDLSNACLGFLNAMVMTANMIEMGQIDTGLIVAGETAEDLINSTINNILTDDSITRKTIKGHFASLTIGSGSVAVVLQRSDMAHNKNIKLTGGAITANTAHNNLCQGAGGNDGTLMQTDSEELLKRGIETAANTWPLFLKNMGWDNSSAHRYFTHQVGIAHSKLLFETLGINPQLNYPTVDVMGNTGSVAAPLGTALAIENNCFKKGEKAAMLGIGSGINCLMLALEHI